MTGCLLVAGVVTMAALSLLERVVRALVALLLELLSDPRLPPARAWWRR